MARARRSDDDAPAPARSDAYVGLLLISLLAQIAGVVFFYLDWSQYGESQPKMPPAATVPATGAPAAGTPGAPGNVAPPPAGGPAGAPKGPAAGGVVK